MMKACTKCGVEKPLDDFHRNRGARDGRETSCKACRAAADSARWRSNLDENRLRMRDRQRELRGWSPPALDPPAVRECSGCGETKPFDEFARAKSCRYGRSYRCRVCTRAAQAEWRAENYETVLAGQRHRDARLLGEAYIARQALRKSSQAVERGAKFVEHVNWLVVLERDDGVCGVCGEDVDPFDFTVDHIIPCAAGGDHSYENVQLAHMACNVKKRNAEDRELIGA